MCFSMLPVSGVFADEQYVTYATEKIPDDFSGHVVEYNVIDTASNGKIVRLDVGLTGITEGTVTYTSCIGFDSTILTYCDENGGELSSKKYASAVVAATYNDGESDVSLIDGDYGLMAKEGTSSVKIEDNSGKMVQGWSLNVPFDSVVTESVSGTFDYNDNVWTPPATGVFKLYSLYLKLQSGHEISDIKSDTIYIDDTLDSAAVHGSLITGAEDATVSEKTLMLNFPEKTYATTFSVTDGSAAVEGATVKATAGGKDYTATTDSTGKAVLDLPAGSYTYTVTKSGFETKSDSITVSNTGNIDVALTKITVTYQVKWKFTDEATSTALKDVSVSVNDTVLISNASGEVTANLPNGSYPYTATLSGYDEVSGTAEVNGSSVSITKTMAKSTVPKYTYSIKVTDKDSAPLSGARVVVYDSTGATKVAEKNTNESGIAEFSLEKGSYQYLVSNGIWYTAGTKTAFTVSGTGSTDTATVELERVANTDEPQYYVKGHYDSDSEKYVVDVTLKNAAAVGASFGMKYDSKILTLAETEYATDNIELTGSTGQSFAPQQNAEGYVTFGWNAKSDGDYVLNATTTPQNIVTYKFTVSEGWEKWVDENTLAVMPWTDTEQGKKDSAAVVAGIWNTETSKYKGLLLNKDSEGNYSDTESFEQDIDMVFEYENQDRCRLTFTVKKQGTEDVIQNATIDIFSTEDSETNLGPITTDENGKAEIVVNKGEYKYIAKADRYWSNPESESPEDYIATGQIDASKDITVELRAKEYHDVEASVTNGTIISGEKTLEDTDTSDTNPATETWTDLAVNGIDFTFVTSPSAGFELDGNPQYTIGDSGEAKDAQFDTLTNSWFVPGDEITDTVKLIVKYKAGKFDVTADMNDGGTLTWAGTPESTTPVTKQFDKGASSGELKFTANEGNVIYQVVINGSEYPISENITEFTYEFEDITQDNTITVIFKGETAEHPEQYVVSVLAGQYGKINVKYDTVDETLTGIDSKDYIVNWADSLTAVVTPDASYEIDKVLVDSAEENLNDDRTTHTVVLGAKPETQSVAAMFRAEGSEESIQYLIRTEVTGMGSVEPFGNKLYYAYEKPKYTFTPESRWKTKSIVFNVGGVDEDKGTITEHTFDNLTGDVLIKATFTEIVKSVTGVVNYAQGTDPSNGKIEKSMPNVVFERVEDGAKFEADFSGAIAPAALTGETNSNFTINLPHGTYTITATKHGHLEYVITDFEVAIDEGATDDVSEPTAVEGKIVLTPGNTNEDKFITFFDILRVVNGMARYGVGSADINEDGFVNIDDMNFAKGNYAAEAVNTDYNTHKTTAPSVGS